MMSIAKLKVRDMLIVRNGAKGEQIAIVARVGKDNVRAHKWLMRGERWTKPVAVYPVEIIRYAEATDFRKRKVKSMAPIGGKQ